VAEAKTRQTDASVSDYLGAIADEERRRDCELLVALMRRATGEEPRIWGTSIIGFGTHRYRYASGHEGETCLAGFSPRKGDISVYITSGLEGREHLLAELGKHRTGKACVYVKRMADIDSKILERLVKLSVAELKQRAATR
jgi:Domain of unknown function (DU1801)